MERSGLDPGRDGGPARWSALGLDPRPDAVARVRRATRAVLRLWGGDAHEQEMSLLISEVVTNAVRHAGTAFDVVLTMDGDTVRCEVRDDDPVMPRLRRSRSHAMGGRGLLLVATLSTTWGVEPDAPGKRVWFELPGGGAAPGLLGGAWHVGGDPVQVPGVDAPPTLVRRPRIADETAPPHPAVVVLPVDRWLELPGRASCEPPPS